MAATQAEPQQNDVNRDSSHQDPSPVAVNTSFQNGTDNGNRRSVIGADVVASKGKKSVRNNVSVDMSQYRQESGPPTNNADQNVNSSEDSGGKLSNSDKSFSHNSEQSGSEVGYGKGGPEGQNMQGYGLGYPSRGGYMHPDGSQVPPGDGMGHHPGNSYGHFPPGMRHPGYPGAKPLPVPPGRPPSGGPPSGPGPGGYPGGPPGQRFALNPSISPPTGPTPTLNQLLQSSNSSHRSYQNSYGEYKPSGEGAQQQQQSGGPPPPAGYGQSWPPGAGPPHPRPALSLSPISSGYQQQPSLYRPPSQTGGGPPGGPPTTGTGGGPGAGPGRGYGPPHQPQQQAGPPQQQAGPPQQPPQQQGSPSPHPPPGPGYPPSSPHHYPQQQQPSPYHQRQPQPIYQMVGGTGTPTANNGAPTGFAPSPGPGPGPHHQPVPGGQESGRPGGGPWSPGPNQGPQQGGPPPHQGPLSHQPPPSSPVSHLHQGYAGSTTQQSSGGPPGRSSEQSPSASTNTHHPEPPELSGQNSNDSSSGGGGPAGPGTPNSGSGLRPTPSPTGSTGSRSMSPAVGQQNVSMPPRPSSGQSESGNGPTRVSHSPMGSGSGPGGGGPGGGVTTPSGYPGPAPGGPGPQGGPPGAPPPHHLNYKMGPHPPPMGPHPHPHPHHHLSYSQQHPQYPQQGGYGSRGGSAMGMPYGGGGGQGYGGQGPPPGQYPPPRPIPNHVPQYPPYQHKVGYGGGMPPSPGSYNSGGGGGTMGPPSSHHPHPGMPPPPPPSSTGAPHEMPPGPGPPPGQPQPSSDSLSPVTSTPPGGLGGGGAGSVTSIVTTGPDGTALDEASQQSTLSNASAASGDDTVLTPSKQQQQQQRVKTEGVGGMLGYHGHPGTPGTVPSPGAASLNSDRYDDYPQDHSPPTWSRTPASPVFNSHVPQDLYRPKKSHDSLGKLYEMDETVERRLWLDKLLGFMEERGTPISACPTISKNPLDLYRLYHFVRERGGFMEVTKNKIWKDIAGSLGIGASSSAAYTLRKHYTKNLLPFECHFDRGGIDPQPIISQVEASSKKKAGKGVAPVPSPGSSNSQDSFQGAGSGNASMDGYSTYPGYPPQDYSSQQQRPPSQSSQGVGVSSQDNISLSNPFEDGGAPRGATPRSGMTGGGGGYGGQGPGYPGQYPGGGEGYGGGYPTPGQYPPPGRPMYPPYVPPASQPDPDRGYNQSNSNSTSNNSSGGGSGGPVASGGSVSSSGPVTGGPPGGGGSGPGGGAPGGGQPGGEYPGRGYPGNSYPGGGRGYPGGAPSPGAATPPAPSQYPTGPDYYRPPEGYYPGPPGAAGPGGGPGKPMPPPAPQPRRHPDFVKDSSQPNYPAYSQPPRPNMYPGWSNSSSGGYPRGGGGYPPGPGGNSGGGGQQWGQAPPRPGAPSPVNHQGAPVQWQPSYQPPQASQGWGMSGGGVQPGGVRPQMGVAGSPRPGYRPNCPVPPHPGASVKGGPGGFGPGGGGLPTKRELVFPIESVEATTPVLYKRRRLNKVDVAPLEAWRVMMALKSGLLSEVTWALDVLNILLFDDTTIAYFGLLHLPGLMDILLEHMKRALSDMLEPSDDRCELELRPEDLGAVSSLPQPQEKSTFLKSADYTYRSRKGHPVTLGVNNNDIFVLDGKRSWDKDDIVEETEQDSRYIISCFKAELGKIPFYRMISGPKEKKNNDVEMEVEVKKEPADKEVEEKKPERKPPERAQKKKKSINDVLSRIKKETLGSDRQEEPPKPPDIKEEHQEEDKEPPAARPAEEMLEVIVKNDTDCEKLSCRIRDPAGTLKRRRISDYEDECYTRDEASLYLVNETQDGIARRCVCISTILRNLTFVPGNELEFAKSGTFLGLLGKLLLLHHEHPPRAAKQRNYDREEDTDFTDSCSSLQADSDWWWEFLHHLRENALVSIANIAGQTDLGLYPEDISRPILDGLLHWAVCPAAQGQDPFPTVSPTSSLSPQRLALEALCKLCVTDSNVDLVIATPPYCRLERLAAVLVRLLCRSEEQVLREFAVNLLYYLGAADSGMARTIALQPACISQLVAFIEQAEQSAVGIANQHGLSALRDNPDTMGTSLDMLRRAAKTLLHLSQHPENKVLFLQQEQRLLSLVMSQILDQQVASVISQVLYQVSRAESPGPSSGGADSKPPAVQQATSQPEQAPHEPALLTSTSTSSS